MTSIKNILLLTCYFLVCSIQAQNLSWTSPENQWHYDFLIAPGIDISYISLSVSRDTTISGLPCSILTPYSPSPEAIYEYSQEIIINEKNGIVLQYADGDFRPLYNFNLEVGDVYDVYVPQPGFPPSNTTLRVDTVTTKVIGGREIRAQYVTTIAGGGFGFSGWNYEFFGNLDFYFVPISLISCDGGCPEG
jgi:hypothetical protein